MNKTAIKNFAVWARNKLIADIQYRAGLMGITAEGIKAALPQSTGTNFGLSASTNRRGRSADYSRLSGMYAAPPQQGLLSAPN